MELDINHKASNPILELRELPLSDNPFTIHVRKSTIPWLEDLWEEVWVRSQPTDSLGYSNYLQIPIHSKDLDG